MPRPIKLRLAALLLAALGSTGAAALATDGAAAAGGPSHAQIFTAVGEGVTCGIAAHGKGPAREILCAALPIPAPKHVNSNVGDPGFVFLAKGGKPKPARLSQYSWQAPGLSHRAILSGGTWTSGAVGVTCTITKTSVRCANKAGHGFTITEKSYKPF
jgi:hypothetical protein